MSGEIHGKFIHGCKIIREDAEEGGRVAENRKETDRLIVNELEFCNRGQSSVRENELLKGRKGIQKRIP